MSVYEGCEVCPFATAPADEFTIIDGDYWVANLRDNDQTLLGTTFITARNHVPEVDYLTVGEWNEFVIVQNSLIGAIRRSFKPVTFNVSCLKNDAFKKDPDTPPPEAAHVHWHVKPRYRTTPIEFNGETFTDPLPGKYLSSFERNQPQRETAIKIAALIRSNL